MNEPVEQYRVRALREFTVSNGRRLKKDEVMTLEAKQAMALIAVQAVVRVRDETDSSQVGAVGLYDRRDMRAPDANSNAASSSSVSDEPERQQQSSGRRNGRSA
jgi:hypothetical protein